MEKNQLDILRTFVNNNFDKNDNVTIEHHNIDSNVHAEILKYLYEYDCEIIRLINIVAFTMGKNKPKFCKNDWIPTNTFATYTLSELPKVNFNPDNYSIKRISFDKRFKNYIVIELDYADWNNQPCIKIKTSDLGCKECTTIELPIIDAKIAAKNKIKSVIETHKYFRKYENDLNNKVFNEVMSNLETADDIINNS